MLEQEPADQHALVDNDLWSRTWRQHSAAIVRFAAYLLSGDHHAAEDVAQETALRLWKHRHLIQSGEPLEGWLRTVARNIIIDRHRRIQARPTEVALTPDVEPTRSDPSEQIEQLQTVDSLLAGLPRR